MSNRLSTSWTSCISGLAGSPASAWSSLTEPCRTGTAPASPSSPLLWQLAFLPFVVAVAALAVHIAPFTWMRIPADFAWAAFVLAYLQGAHVQATRHQPTITRQASRYPSPLPLPEVLWRGLLLASSWMMSLCYVWFALLEASGVLYSSEAATGILCHSQAQLYARRQNRIRGIFERDRPVIRQGSSGTLGIIRI